MIALSKSAPRRAGALIALALIAGISSYPIAHSALGQDRKPAADADDLRHAFALSDAFKQVAKSVSPSVVNIRSTQKIALNADNSTAQPGEDGGSLDSPFGDEFFRRFFGQDAPQGQLQPRMPRERVGEGTGVIVKSDGFIITNNHVVTGADEIRVKLDDDREYPATVVGTDPESDLAVIKIDASSLVPAKFGDSDKLEQGDWVLALGSPFGLQHTVTAGIVSAKGRSEMHLATYEDFIQTDAAINPGNSGGPLVNLYGEVVGLNTAISTRSGGYEGIGFAIPSAMVKSVTDSIIENGKVKRGWLGIEMQPLTKDLAASFGAKSADGVLIARVLPDGPAKAAGLKKGDIVTSINGKNVATSSQLLQTVGTLAPGQEAKLKVLRDGQTKEIAVKLADRSEQLVRNTGGRNNPGNRNGQGNDANPSDNLGMTLRELTPQLARQLGVDRDTQGVVVGGVQADSIADKAGIERGDIIAAIGDTDILSADDVDKALQSQDLSAGVRVEVVRQGTHRFVILKNEKNDKKSSD